MRLRLGKVEIETENDFQGFAAAAVAELQAAKAVETANPGPEYHLQLAGVFAQLETAHQIELLRKQLR